MKIRKQRGVSTVEFAIVAALLMIMILGVIEIGRAYYMYAMLDEVTRRGARLAAVCPVNDPAIPQLAVFNAAGDTSNSTLAMGLSPANVVIEYLDANNAVVANPGNAAGFVQIRYVRARVVGFVHQIQVPFVTGIGSVLMPELATVLPRESLGVPRDGALTPC
jgi:Flp pilus assembly protein TadG